MVVILITINLLAYYTYSYADGETGMGPPYDGQCGKVKAPQFLNSHIMAAKVLLDTISLAFQAT